MPTQEELLWMTYAEITKRAAEQIERCIADAHRRTGLQALIRREWAYGAYISWRALMMEISDQPAYLRDDRRLEGLLNEMEPLGFPI